MSLTPIIGAALPASAKERLIFALDVDHLDEAERLVTVLAPHVGMFKVGPRLFTGAGVQVLDLIQSAGGRLFLDLKFHDIPATVAGAAREAARLRAQLFTVHALGGPRMIREVAAELSRQTTIPGMPRSLCLAVTVLTSHTQAEVEALGFTEPLVELASRLARSAVAAGADGVVASGHEVRALREVLPPSTVYVVPGIRGPGDDVGDQSRVMTAREAVEAGATWVVVGRPIRSAADPAAAAQRLIEDMERART